MKSRPATLSLSKKSIQSISGSPFTEGNHVTLVWKDRESFQRIFDEVRAATHTICLQFYIFRNDETGKELAEILKMKAREGVAVFIIYDHFGSLFTPWSFWQELKDCGVRIAASYPFKWTAPFRYVHRDHRKLIIIDGIRAFTGGINIANEYRGYYRRKSALAWRDTGIFLEGPIVTRLSTEFRKSWEIWNGSPIPDVREGGPVAGGVSVLPIFASSARSRRRMRRLIYYGITNAQKSIYLTNAYFIPSMRLLYILESAAARNVDVKLLLPGISDVSPAYYAGRAFFSRLLRAGIEIYTYNGVILHAKSSVFDSLWSIIGSANLDFQSLRRNDEGNVGIMDEGFGRQMTEVFFDDLSRSEKITPEQWRQRPFLEKAREFFFALFRMKL
jgi:cardiolipin synthase